MRRLSLLALAVSLPALAQVGNLQLSTAGLNFSAISGSGIPQSQIVGVSSTGVPLPVNVSIRYFTATEGWLSVAANSDTTPSNITVTVTPSGLTPGIYNGQVLVIASGSQSGLVTVSLTVTNINPGGSLISVNPTSVALTSGNGQVVQSSVTLSSTGSIPFQVFVSTSSGGNWLSYAAVSTTSPTSIAISANPAGLTSGLYNGIVNIAPSTGAPGVAIPIAFTVGAGGSMGGFSLSPNSLNFIYQTGAANPASQSTFVNNFNGIVNFVATSSTSWARLTSTNSSIPSQSVTGAGNSSLSVTVDPAGLSRGVYNATVTVTASNASSQTLAVTLTVSGNSLFSASPNSFIFNHNPDAGIPLSQQTVITSSGSAVAFAVSANSTGWLLAGPQIGSTNGSNVLTVSVNPAGLTAGTYNGSVNIVGGMTSLNIPVTLTVGTTSVNTITASPQSLSFQSLAGSPSASQTLFLTSAAAKNFLASANASGGNWLQVTPSNGVTPASLTVSITPLAVGQAGAYNGVVQISNLGDGTQLAIPVTMTLSGAAIGVSPQNLSFSLSAGASAPASQTAQISGTANNSFTASSDSPWLTASPNSGTIPGSISVSASAANLSTGNYAGIVTVTSGGATANVMVTLNVTNSAAPILTPSNLTFQYTPGAALPSGQSIAVGSTFGIMSFVVTSSTSLGGNWLRVTSNTTATPATLTVNVLPASLAAGTYRGTITVSTSAGADVRTAEITLAVTAPTGPILRSALHAATRQLSAVTPGMILSLEGGGLGPMAGVNGTITAAGAFETTLNGYRVLFDGVAAPILYSGEGRMDVVAPYAIATRQSTRVHIENAGARSDAIELRLSPDAAPGIFSLDSSGRGQAAALNADGTVNGPSNPALQNSVLVFYATGEGQTRPAGQDGRIIATDLRVPILPVTASIGGVLVEVLYAGSAPNQVSGLMQINVRLTPGVPSGIAVPLALRVGPAPSQAGITVAIQ